MSKNLHHVLLAVLPFCLALLLGCSSSGSGGDAKREAKILEFSNMEVETNSRSGFFGGRYVSFKVTGSVTNHTGKPINKDNIPALTWNDGKDQRLKADLSESKLLDDETCDVSYEDELSVGDAGIPELSFAGKVEFAGLDEAEEELNSQLQAIAEGYAEEDAKKDEERKAKEQAEADAAQKTADDRQALEDCKGKKARAAYNVAKETEFVPIFKDSFGVDVTDAVKNSERGSAVRKALVIEVEIEDAGWFSDASVTFTIDYVDPEAQQKREKKEQEEREKKEREEFEASLTTSQRNALRAAERYLDYTNFSHDGLVDQLEYEQYSNEDAVFAADHCGADWNEQALGSAKNYLDYTAFSYDGLVGQLEYEKFTHEQAVYGVDHCGADWNEQAAKKAEDYLDFMSFSRGGLIDQLMYEGFTYDQASHGADSVGL